MKRQPRLCFIGPMAGRNSGYVTTQGQILSDLFANEGYSVISASALINRYSRLLDIIATLVRHHGHVDIVCLNVYSGPSFVVADAASFLGKLFGLKIVMVLRGGNLPEFMARFPNWAKRVLARANVLVAPSHYLIEAAGHHGFCAELIPNVIDLSQYPYHHRSSVEAKMFWMRSFHEVYNPEMAVHVLAKLKEQLPNAHLIMGGQDKGLQAAVQQLVKDLRLENAVEFPGFLNNTQKVKYAGAADLFINTNRIDNMPVAVVEACAMGLPVVATSVGGIPYLLTDQDSGLLVPNEDVQAMADAVYRLATTPALADKLSANGRKLAERSSWEQVRLQWEDLFARVL